MSQIFEHFLPGWVKRALSPRRKVPSALFLFFINQKFSFPNLVPSIAAGLAVGHLEGMGLVVHRSWKASDWERAALI